MKNKFDKTLSTKYTTFKIKIILIIRKKHFYNNKEIYIIENKHKKCFNLYFTVYIFTGLLPFYKNKVKNYVYIYISYKQGKQYQRLK